MESSAGADMVVFVVIVIVCVLLLGMLRIRS